MMELEFDTLGKKMFGKSFSSSSNRAKVIREKRETEIQATLFDEPVRGEDDQGCATPLQDRDDAEAAGRFDRELVESSEFLFRHRNHGVGSSQGATAGHRLLFQAAYRLLRRLRGPAKRSAMAVARRVPRCLGGSRDRQDSATT